MNEQSKLVSKIILFLYLIVGFIPYQDTTLDAISTQWLYINILNLISLSYLFIRKNTFSFSIDGKAQKVFFIIYLGYFLSSCVSSFNALVPSESVIGISRLFSNTVALFIVYLIFKKLPKESVNFFIFIISVLTVFECYHVFDFFFTNFDKPRVGNFLSGFKTRYGNRNVLASSITLKIPFLLYTFVLIKGKRKIIIMSLIIAASTSVFLIGARTAILSMFLIFFIFIVTAGFNSFKKGKNTMYIISNHISMVLFLLIAFFIATNVNLIYKNKSNSFDDLINTKSKYVLDKNYKTPPVIGKGKGKDASGRMLYWQLAIENFKEHPIIGVGIGNWKMYSKAKLLRTLSSNKYTYPKRVHNDFLQVLAETGLIGFLFFISFLLIICFIIIKNILWNFESDNFYVFLAGGLSFMVYIFDALLNFPHERTPIQISLIFILVILLVFHQNSKDKKGFIYAKYILLFLIITSFVSLKYNYLVFKSSQVQRLMFNNYVGKDLLKATYNISYDEIINRLPDFPIINEIGRPIEHSKAMFAYSEKKYDLALQHLTKSMKIAPAQVEHMGLKAILFYKEKEIQNLDSAFYYAKKVFDISPAIKANLTILKKHYVDKKDTMMVFKTINTYLKTVTNDVGEWINKAKYIKLYYNDSKRALQVIDSAILLNPNNKKIKAYKTDKFKINNKVKASQNTVKSINSEAEVKFIKEHYALGMKYFNAKKHQLAKAEFDKVRHVVPNNNANLINLALVEIKLKNYQTAISYLDKVIAAKFMINGQPEYNRGLCYIRLGNKKKAAEDFNASIAKGYEKAKKISPKLLKN